MSQFHRTIMALAAAAMFGAACADAPLAAPERRSPAVAAHRDETCDPTTAIIPCDDPGDGDTGGFFDPPRGYSLGITMAGCSAPVAGDDADRDGFSDACEFTLATAFAPKMMMTAQYPNLAALSGGGMWPGEYYWGVTAGRVGGVTRVRLAYLPAYYKDFGHGSYDNGHNGDSEFIMIDVEFVPSTGRFEMRDAFLSAHCGATQLDFSVDPDCQWWGTSYWNNYGDWVDNSLGAPVVYVASGTNANYYSRSKCNSGTYSFDDCSGTYDGGRFPVTPGFNVGSWIAPMIPVDIVARRHPGFTLAGATESFWAWNTFIGWHGFAGWQGGDGQTAYSEILYRFGFGGPLGTDVPVCNPDPAAIIC